jgi:hypothetical protein
MDSIEYHRTYPPIRIIDDVSSFCHHLNNIVIIIFIIIIVIIATIISMYDEHIDGENENPRIILVLRIMFIYDWPNTPR